MTVIHCMKCMSPGCIGCPPSEPTTAEAFATVRKGISPLQFDEVATATRALDALALLERRMQESPPLAVLVEAFCQEVEAAETAQEAKRRGGQQVPFHGPFGHLQPSVRGELNRWARHFREALKR